MKAKKVNLKKVKVVARAEKAKLLRLFERENAKITKVAKGMKKANSAISEVG